MQSELKQRFETDGYVAPLLAMDADQASEGLKIVERLEQQGVGRLPHFLRTKPHLLVPWFWDLVHSPAILSAVTAVLGKDVLCYGSSFIDKRPGDGNHVAWHQDVTYWGLSEHRAATAWIALTPSNSVSGAVSVLPGSHHTLLPHTDSNDPTNMLGRGEKLVTDIDETAGHDLVLEPGEFSLHDGMIIHGSHPNKSDHRRLGFVARYIPASVGLTDGAKSSATLVAGQSHGTLELEQKPETEMGKDALERHRAIFRSGMSTIFRGKLKGTNQ